MGLSNIICIYSLAACIQSVLVHFPNSDRSQGLKLVFEGWSPAEWPLTSCAHSDRAGRPPPFISDRDLARRVVEVACESGEVDGWLWNVTVPALGSAQCCRSKTQVWLNLKTQEGVPVNDTPCHQWVPMLPLPPRCSQSCAPWAKIKDPNGINESLIPPCGSAAKHAGNIRNNKLFFFVDLPPAKSLMQALKNLTLRSTWMWLFPPADYDWTLFDDNLLTFSVVRMVPLAH